MTFGAARRLSTVCQVWLLLISKFGLLAWPTQHLSTNNQTSINSSQYLRYIYTFDSCVARWPLSLRRWRLSRAEHDDVYVLVVCCCCCLCVIFRSLCYRLFKMHCITLYIEFSSRSAASEMTLEFQAAGLSLWVVRCELPTLSQHLHHQRLGHNFLFIFSKNAKKPTNEPLWMEICYM